MYPALITVNWSPLNQISENAAISMLYKANFLAIMPVCCSGLLDTSWSRRVLTFHAPTYKLYLLLACFLFVFLLLWWTAISCRLMTNLMVKQAFVWATLSRPVRDFWVISATLEIDCSYAFNLAKAYCWSFNNAVTLDGSWAAHVQIRDYVLPACTCHHYSIKCDLKKYLNI